MVPDANRPPTRGRRDAARTPPPGTYTRTWPARMARRTSRTIEPDADDQEFGVGCYSQSFFLKTTYRLTHTTAISTTANGYPPAQCSSGMWSKFMP